jgi:hypothetical protein
LRSTRPFIHSPASLHPASTNSSSTSPQPCNPASYVGKVTSAASYVFARLLDFCFPLRHCPSPFHSSQLLIQSPCLSPVAPTSYHALLAASASRELNSTRNQQTPPRGVASTSNISPLQLADPHSCARHALVPEYPYDHTWASSPWAYIILRTRSSSLLHHAHSFGRIRSFKLLRTCFPRQSCCVYWPLSLSRTSPLQLRCCLCLNTKSKNSPPTMTTPSNGSLAVRLLRTHPATR